ncbi:MAG: phosphoenolpyruvate--protein phosphotransferase [Myxococcales bacterium]|nr:phosphoenolpyruvate--protein phosphotransferase [Myxococcales bacterium]
MAIGPAYVVDRRKVQIPRRSVDKADVDAEIHRFRKGLRDTQAQLEKIKSRLPHGEHRQILKAQQLMLRDPDLASRVEQLVREEQICAEWALARVTDEIRDTLRQADDEYFRERSSDITFLAERVLLTLRGEHPEEIKPPAGAVVIAHDLPPADTVELARTEVVGMVTAVGGQTSHSAIVARSMEIPAIVGVEDIDQEVEHGDTVIVDAINGVVVVRPSADELEQWEQIRDRYEQFEDRVQREHGLPASARDGTHITLRANVALEAEIGSALFHGAEGVGLYRTEFPFMIVRCRPRRRSTTGWPRTCCARSRPIRWCSVPSIWARTSPPGWWTSASASRTRPWAYARCAWRCGSARCSWRSCGGCCGRLSTGPCASCCRSSAGSPSCARPSMR